MYRISTLVPLLLLVMATVACSSESAQNGDSDATADINVTPDSLFPGDTADSLEPDLPSTPDAAETTPDDSTSPDLDAATPDLVDVADSHDNSAPDLLPDTPQEFCGDSICQDDEECSTCPQDCGTCPPVCGDGACTSQESCIMCPQDCGQCPASCGDKNCDENETCQVCPQDCGPCPVVCGDATCNGNETCKTCIPDCGPCPPECGDGECQQSESCATCSADCGQCPVPCGDGVCEPLDGETCSTCIADCGPCPFCGDDQCGEGETCTSCPTDCYCPPECGDASCNGAETCDSCPDDCGACIVCGDGECHASETCDSCQEDCGQCNPVCGNLQCESEEDCQSCAVDCGLCPSQCGNSTCDTDEDCTNCPQDCGTCPPLLYFTPWWEENLSGGPIVQGGQLRLKYSLDRLKDCRATHNGHPGWSITLYYTFDLAEPAQQLPAVMHNSFSGTSTEWEQTIDIPEDAENIWFWASNTDVSGCETWDSDFAKNYMFPIFSQQTVQQDVSWAGNFQFIYFTGAGPQFRGDVDPAYYFSNFAGSKVATWVQFEVYVPGITDRTYQDNFVMKQVAQNALKALVNTNAYYPDGDPTAAMKDIPLDVVNPAGNNFVYRWVPPMYIGDGDYIPEGVYHYFLRVATWFGENGWSFGKTSNPADPRTMVLGILMNCSLFPFNPPPEFCQ